MLKPSLVVVSVTCLFGLSIAPVWGRTSTVPGLKSASDCAAEYKANKGALKNAKEKKSEFIKACRALLPGQPTPVGAASAAPAPVAPPSTASASQPAAPTAPTRTAPPVRTAAVATGANQFTSEATAKGRCPSTTVVWVNTRSHIYHFAGTKNYGNTKTGAYMCETDATAAGDRASNREKHP